MTCADKMDEVYALLEQLRVSEIGGVSVEEGCVLWDRFVFLIYRIFLESSSFAAVGYNAFPNVPTIVDHESKKDFLTYMNALVADMNTVSSQLRDLESAMCAVKSYLSNDELLQCEAEFKKEQSTLSDALLRISSMRTRLMDLQCIDRHHSSHSAGVVVPSSSSSSSLQRRREETTRVFLDTMRFCDAAREALRESSRTSPLTVEMSTSTLSSPQLIRLTREVAELRAMRAKTLAELHHWQTPAATSHKEQWKEKEEKDEKEEKEEKEELEELRRANASLRAEFHAGCAALREQRGDVKIQHSLLQSIQSPSLQSSSSSSLQSLQSRWAFATARRDRLRREVAQLTRACEVERAEHQTLIHSSSNSNSNSYSSSPTHAHSFTRDSSHGREWVEQIAVEDLAWEARAQASIANTLRAQLHTHTASTGSM
ncbi:uncharacterized protein TM35_000171390 [Trypanosoma theileri]|uniref:Uncharacterized protein n=1 Tax=Trypanosoma theileri TaxID=67003 RepID=A0A1X0NU77_9TRYP|nr:uncharacterized protein TM35_000171390 [Trypanosoma theileri]ORC88267.1 hypothetical protein TM35_000171390 [Trypanosoma theileri]